MNDFDDNVVEFVFITRANFIILLLPELVFVVHLNSMEEQERPDSPFRQRCAAPCASLESIRLGLKSQHFTASELLKLLDSLEQTRVAVLQTLYPLDLNASQLDKAPQESGHEATDTPPSLQYPSLSCSSPFLEVEQALAVVRMLPLRHVICLRSVSRFYFRLAAGVLARQFKTSFPAYSIPHPALQHWGCWGQKCVLGVLVQSPDRAGFLSIPVPVLLPEPHASIILVDQALGSCGAAEIRTLCHALTST